MSEKITLKIIAVNEFKYLSAMPFSEFCTYFEGLKNQVPTEYFDSAKISISDPPPSGGDCQVIVSYRRLETDEENATRDQIEADAQAEVEAERVAELVKIAENNPDVLQVVEGVV